MLKIEKTTHTPEIVFDTKKMVLSIVGRLISSEPEKFFAPVEQWLNKNSGKPLLVKMNLEYTNNNSKKVLQDMLRAYTKADERNLLSIRWHFETDDDDMKELGEDFEQFTNCHQFEYIAFET